MTFETDQLLYECRGATAFVTFNRPQAHNAMTWEMYEALYECCEEVDSDESVRVLVLRGAGEEAFVAGTDINQFLEFSRSGEDGISYEERMERVIGRLEKVRKPTIALIDGYAIGGGLSIAAVCDLRVCTPEAKFGIPIARTLGNCLSIANYARLVALIGSGRTKELILTAKIYSAQEALGAGLATEIVPTSELEARVEELLARLSSHAPITMRVTKEALRCLTLAGLPDAEDLVIETYGSEDFHEGVSAFVEKRRPVWRGT
jgi:enoyl-CoA hydratase/carnithine racemase